uniref:Uncharacterized protein n=1 Tax=Rhodnius prolixus TaxID=13249 RepID=T1HNH6_RHOPR
MDRVGAWRTDEGSRMLKSKLIFRRFRLKYNNPKEELCKLINNFEEKNMDKVKLSLRKLQEEEPGSQEVRDNRPGMSLYNLNLLEDRLYSSRYGISSPIQTANGPRSLAVTAGAAQGSILGPGLWNVAYDSLLRQDMPEETALVGYADDVAALCMLLATRIKLS